MARIDNTVGTPTAYGSNVVGVATVLPGDGLRRGR